MYAPLNYDQINEIAGQYSPSQIKAYNNESFAFWERSLFQRACSTIEFNVPWLGKTKNFLLYCLWKFGYVAVFDHNVYGLSFQPATLNGFNFYYQPTEAIISNPAYQDRLVIGNNCELLQLTPDYFGTWDIISYYAKKLSELDKAINISIINNTTPNILGAKNKSAAAALKKVVDEINKGTPIVVYDKIIDSSDLDGQSPFESLMREHIKESYITTDQLRDFQTILNNFDTEIGIPTIPYEKKERMVSSEVDSRIIDSQSRATIWVDCLNSSMSLINQMFNTSMSATLRFNPEKIGGDSDVNNENDSTRNE